ALMGVDHAEIGARIAQKWNFSNQLVNIIKYHHNIEESSGSEKEVSLINLVNYLLIKGQYGMFENFPIVLLLDDYCKQTLNITDENIEEYSQEIHASAENWEEC
ncbi:HDOD domain-containing protein, partial [Arthrospira platensis SPKY1]|nr:HDOD domain-containing protein [Arthrospira platensis SPKY1]